MLDRSNILLGVVSMIGKRQGDYRAIRDKIQKKLDSCERDYIKKEDENE